jgi:Cdc6-like AAA superfamily ATPase
MDRLKNPFAPGAGTAPPELVGRSSVFEEASVTFGRIKNARSAKSFLLVGLRGVGKTVLLNRLQEMAESQGYRAHFIEAPENKRLPALLIPQLRKLLLELDRGQQVNAYVKKALGTLKSFASAFKFSYGDLGSGPINFLAEMTNG